MNKYVTCLTCGLSCIPKDGDICSQCGGNVKSNWMDITSASLRRRQSEEVTDYPGHDVYCPASSGPNDCTCGAWIAYAETLRSMLKRALIERYTLRACIDKMAELLESAEDRIRAMGAGLPFTVRLWISVSEKLPEDGQVVDTICVDGNRYCDIVYRAGQKWPWREEDGSGYWEPAGEVSHWMPRPDSPTR